MRYSLSLNDVLKCCARSSLLLLLLLWCWGLFSELNLRLGCVECIFSLYDCFSYITVLVVSKDTLQCAQGDVVIENYRKGRSCCGGAWHVSLLHCEIRRVLLAYFELNECENLQRRDLCIGRSSCIAIQIPKHVRNFDVKHPFLLV